MRIAVVLLLLASPPLASAEPPHAPGAAEPAAHKPGLAKPQPVSAKPGAAKLGAAKLGAVKPGAVKPGAAKPGVARGKPPAAPPAPPPVVEVPRPSGVGSKTGLPLPRFAALRSDDVNFRRGPGDRYPIEWVYKRRDLPVEIEREFDVWRLVSDPQGTKGWVNSATLSGRRTAIVVGGERVLRQGASDASAPVAKLEAGVILRLRSCEPKSEWCQVAAGDYRGFIRRGEVWGLLPDEVIQ